MDLIRDFRFAARLLVTHDPITLLSIVVLLTVVAVAACVGPTRRATRLDPLSAIRHE